MLSVYGRMLRWTLRFRPVMLLLSFAVIAATVYMFELIPKGFIPSEDSNSLNVSIEAEQGTAPQEMFRYVQAVSDIALKDPNIDRFNANAGGGMGMGGGGGSNTGGLQLRLKPRAERELSADQVMAELRRRLAVVPGVQIFIQNPPPIRIGGMMTRALYQYTLQGPDTAELYATSQKFEKELAALPGLLDVQTDLLLKKPTLNVAIDRDKAAALKLSVDQIENALAGAYSTRFISNIFTPSNQYQVIMEALPEYQDSPSDLSMLYLRSGNGNLVPLSAVTTTTQTVSAQSINHLGQLPAVTISYNLAPGVSLGQALDEINEVVARSLPSTISATSQGTAQAFQTSFANLYAHSSAHDLLRAALGGLRGLVDALSVPCRAEHLLVCGTDHADRHREEERHHADRFRAHRRAGGRHAAYGGDLSGLSGPLPPDHDDHDGGHAGSHSDRHRLWRGRQSPAAAGAGGGRRAALLAARDAVSNACLLHLSRGSTGVVQDQEEPEPEAGS
jgi:multidrug efflux pump subunit AcrB